MPRPSSRGQRFFREWLVVGLLSSGLLLALVWSDVLGNLDNLLYDMVLRADERPASGDVLIVAIDDRSIAEIGRWPWPRTVHAQMIERLAQAGPRAVVYDVLLVDPERGTDGDEAFARAAAAAGNVYLPLLLDVPGRDGAPYDVVPPVAPIAASVGLGHVDLALDPDGRVRRVYLEEGGAPAWVPHLMKRVHDTLAGHTAKTGGTAASEVPQQGLGRRMPVLIPYPGPPGHHATVSFSSVLRGEVPADFLRGRVVFVGSTAMGLGDHYSVPVSDETSLMSGVEIMAGLFSALQEGRVIEAMGKVAVAAISLLFLWLLMIGFLLLSPRSNTLLAFGLALLALATSLLALRSGGLWFPPAATLTVLLAVYPLWGWRRLDVAGHYMVDALGELVSGPDWEGVPLEPARRWGDTVARQMELMGAAIRHDRERRRFLFNVLQSLPDATVLVAPDGSVILSNGAATTLFAPFKGETLGERMAHFIRSMRPVSTELTSLPLPVETGENLLEIEAVSATGIACHVRYTLCGDPASGVAYWLVMISDITALKEAERQRDRILQLLTHDMRSPQTSILSLLDSARGSIDPQLGRKIAAYARRTLSLADGFVHLARARTVNYALEEVDLSDVLLEAVDELWPQSSEKNIAIHTSGCEEEFLVEADRGLMTRAFINLISNAIKYSDPGTEVLCTIGREGDVVRCVVADHGWGMSEEQVAALFKPFQRFALAHAGYVDGAGLGMALVETVVTRHGGTIECISRPREGTTVILRFPALAQGASLDG